MWNFGERYVAKLMVHAYDKPVQDEFRAQLIEVSNCENVEVQPHVFPPVSLVTNDTGLQKDHRGWKVHTRIILSNLRS